MLRRCRKKFSGKKLLTSGRIGRIVKITLTRVKRSTAENVYSDIEKFNSLHSAAKADYVRNMIARMRKYIGNAKTKDIMKSCGMMCCGISSRRIAGQIRQESNSLKEIIQKLNKGRLGGGRLKLKNKNTITGGYDRCYCGMVSKTRTPFPDLTYCNCSTGWYKQLFETALGRPVSVKIIRSIISGSKTCEFTIKIIKK